MSHKKHRRLNRRPPSTTARRPASGRTKKSGGISYERLKAIVAPADSEPIGGYAVVVDNHRDQIVGVYPNGPTPEAGERPGGLGSFSG